MIDSPSLYGLTSLDVLPQGKAIPQKTSRDAEKGGVSMLYKELSSVLMPVRRASESGQKNQMGSEESSK